MELDDAKEVADLVSVDAAVTGEGRILYANSFLRDRLWRKKMWDRPDGRYLWECFEEDQEEEVRAWYEGLRERGEVHGTLVLEGGDGQGQGERVHAIDLADRELVVIRWAGTVLLAERYQELERLTEMFREYQAAGPLGLMILQDSGKDEATIRYMNAEGAELLERDVTDLLGHPVSEFLAPEDREAAIGRYHARMQGERIDPNQTVRMLTPEGGTLIMDVVVGSTTWEGAPAAFALLRDETSHLLTTEELRRFAQGFDMITDTLVLADRDFNILYVNPTGLRRSGYSFEEVLGRPATIFASTQPDEVDPLDLAVELFEKGHWHGERTAVSKEGRLYPVELSVTMNRDPSGEPEMITVLSRDISERREAEERLHMARERAEFFTDLLSHDTNNYIQAVLGWLDMLARGDLDDAQREHLGNAREQAQRASDLIARVRSLAKVQEAGGLRPMDLNIALDEGIGDLRQRYGEGSFQLELELPEGEVLVMADELLKDMIINVLDNAVKHALREPPVVEVRVERVPVGTLDHLRLSIADHGPGIPDGAKVSVFYRYVRREGGEEGAGLGLSLVWALADRYDGKVWIEDRVPGEPEEGARVILELPSA